MNASSAPLTFAFLLLATALFLTGCDSLGGGEPGSGTTPGIPEPTLQESPRWSPDGKTILYYDAGIVNYDPETKTALHDERMRGIWTMDLESGRKRKLLEAYAADWSPDGEAIVFETGAQLYTVRLAGDSVDASTLVRLTPPGGRNHFFPDWSPNGEWITYDSNTDSPNGMYFVWKVRSDGSERLRIAYAPEMGEVRQPSWSPDSKTIVHYRYVGVDAPEIFTMNADGSNSVRLTFNRVGERDPKYSPDGRTILFSSNGLWVMDADGNNQRQLTTEGAMPDWSPDGRRIVYIGPQQTLWVMDADGSNRQQLTTRPELGPIE